MSLVELQRYADPMLAQIVRGRLEAAGIPAFCFDTGMNIAEDAPLAVQARLMVLAEDLEDARALLAEDEGPGSDQDGAT
ncbi:hypothetical protein SLG_38460 [Sphingobium sp. SYK-6]|uniref:putative signal transducing protein n=1 Tax=Sphingobium sp. (strain NBRC 103272 / SYK-6) TaxID=627192 RepID=UPI0002277FE4|nr:DUF2007 domain-containing protein [Sphingobium sp. SYK-6]BAK68521.1 hypothetical protein SLG_38460 [Sphingobium sp. SYK-6]